MFASWPYSLALVFAAALSALLAVWSWRLRRTPGAAAFIGLLVATSLYSAGYACELTSGTLGEMLFWNKIQYLGIPFIPVFWLLMAAAYSGRSFWLRRRVVAALLASSVLTILLNYTNGLHHLFYRSASVKTSGPFPVIALSKGVLFWVYIGYANAVLVAGTWLLVDTFRRTALPYRKQTAVMLAAAALPWLGFLCYLSGLSPLFLDTTPLCFTVAGPIFAWGLFHYGIFDIAPVAKDSVFASMRDGAIVLDGRNRIIDFNPAAAALIHELTPRSRGRSLDELLSVCPNLLKLLGPDGGQGSDCEFGDGDERRYYHARISSVSDVQGRPLGKVLLISDVTELGRLMDRLREQSTIDDLTRLFNRRHFLEAGRKEIERAKRFGTPLSLVLVDLDHFKTVNDTWGHEVGDAVLQEVSRRFRNCLRTIDVPSRHGGEEFAILLPQTPPTPAGIVAERMRQALLDRPVEVSPDIHVRITASFGVAGWERVEDQAIEDLIRLADAALYDAKGAGRDSVRTASGGPGQGTSSTNLAEKWMKEKHSGMWES